MCDGNNNDINDVDGFMCDGNDNDINDVVGFMCDGNDDDKWQIMKGEYD